MTNSGVKSADDEYWVKHTFIPKCAEAGLVRVGVVRSKDVFAKFYVDKITDSYEENKLSVAYFSSVAEAHAWFESFNN